MMALGGRYDKAEIARIRRNPTGLSAATQTLSVPRFEIASTTTMVTVRAISGALLDIDTK
jgi:hypothetical protein